MCSHPVSLPKEAYPKDGVLNESRLRFADRLGLAPAPSAKPCRPLIHPAAGHLHLNAICSSDISATVRNGLATDCKYLSKFQQFGLSEARSPGRKVCVLTKYKIENNTINETAEPGAGLFVFVAPDEQERTLLREQFGLDEYDLASALDADEIPRLETSGDRTFIIWKIPERAQIGAVVDLGVQTIGIVMRQNKMALIMNRGEVLFSAREFRGVNSNAAFLLAYLLHGIRHYVGHLRAIKMMSGELEKQITVSMENRYLLQMFNLSECLIYYIDSIEGNNVVLSKLRAIAPSLGADPLQMQTLDDIILESNQAARQANIYSTILSGLMDARGTIINNNMNVLLTNLTLINIIFLPLNLIASIGGMSEWSMMTRRLDWRISYSLFCVGMVVLGWFTWKFVRRFIGHTGGHSSFTRKRKF
jgi:magnesium transporter